MPRGHDIRYRRFERLSVFERVEAVDLPELMDRARGRERLGPGTVGR